MYDYMKKYKDWIAEEGLDSDLRKELETLRDDEGEIKDRFYQDLGFGTAGLRGKLGAGTNRMNRYVVGRATRALGRVIQKHRSELEGEGVAIAYDCRIMSPEFAEECALILAGMGIKAFLFESLRPTPELSFAVRYLKCAAGINITASHNPKIYNGYKVYWESGAQIKSDIADQILEEISHIGLFEQFSNPTMEDAVASGLVEIIGDEIDEAFYEKTMSVSLRDEEVDKDIKIIYTPFNGAGNIPVRTVLKRMGYANVFVVREQEEPDGTFPTIDYPNPEDHAAFALAEELALRVGGDILIATDPDCDRVAAEIVHKGEIVALNGNQVGVLLMHYMLSSMKEKNLIPEKAAVVKSIVTSEMGTAIAESYGVRMFNVLTGFKNICALPNEWDKTKEWNYIFGYEESIGYNIGSYLRDKDGVASVLMLSEAAGYYKKQGKTLIDAMEDLYVRYGYYLDNTVSLVLEGIEGQARIKRMMESYRKGYPLHIGDSSLVEVTDYRNSSVLDVKTGETTACTIEKTDAVRFSFDDGCWYALRPSGTEPKIKLYVYSKAAARENAEKKVKEIEREVLELLDRIE
ncbi:phospho-sugar mutase [Anaerobium acetethylicum]|uniref:Phosphoglucomutase n=1 Tax=Anaerobium acetethylicum TaxID=1619234 RepID=A0A1D3TQW4_9FIRM|nr:phospho-sugar mutase [Anaerobium acetethylicum]SCP96013.1 phosphoglucomutase [Anaerobium acetethylicum]